MSKHTLGPWEVMQDDDELRVIQSNSMEYGDTWRSYTPICSEISSDGNANLIAAAPDLLEALEAIIYEGGTLAYSSSHPVAIAAVAAIAKAKGES
ncbi:hypothetical protein [Pectobacterium versatile]|uniref:hypothetical protein n=1 Tax=Pectobacterium versatile TaxID=2488639 RepID=UPI001F3B3128|nr:hypothetical protein [Pectobacterium versatile]